MEHVDGDDGDAQQMLARSPRSFHLLNFESRPYSFSCNYIRVALSPLLSASFPALLFIRFFIPFLVAVDVVTGS